MSNSVVDEEGKGDDEELTMSGPVGLIGNNNNNNLTMAAVNGGGSSDEDLLDSPAMMAVKFYRRLLLQTTTVVLVSSLLDILFTPIEVLLLLPCAVMVSYWLRDAGRFVHGGDPRQCINRDCALQYYSGCCFFAALISLYDIVALSTTRSNTSSSSSHGSMWFGAAIAVNAVTLGCCVVNLFVIHKMTRLLRASTVGSGATTTMEGYAV